MHRQIKTLMRLKIQCLINSLIRARELLIGVSRDHFNNDNTNFFSDIECNVDLINASYEITVKTDTT